MSHFRLDERFLALTKAKERRAYDRQVEADLAEQDLVVVVIIIHVEVESLEDLRQLGILLLVADLPEQLGLGHKPEQLEVGGVDGEAARVFRRVVARRVLDGVLGRVERLELGVDVLDVHVGLGDDAAQAVLRRVEEPDEQSGEHDEEYEEEEAARFWLRVLFDVSFEHFFSFFIKSLFVAY